MASIVQKDDPVLRQIAEEVPEEMIQSPKIGAVLKRMKAALDAQDDGVAIAAPQIGETLRIFIVSKHIFELPEDAAREENAGGKKIKKKLVGHLVFINPRLTKLSKEKAPMEEGCLSVRYLYGKVERSVKAAVEAYDERGKKFSRGAAGLLAQIFQHEIDHLDGVLFIDKARDVKDMPPENNNRQQ